MIVAIDGPSGTGKSTVAKKVAQQLGYIYFNTGAMYRSFALFIRSKNIAPDDVEKMKAECAHFAFDIQHEKGQERYVVNGHDVTEHLALEEISKTASILSAFQEIRSFLLPIQQQFGAKHNVVLEGRDIGTVVFPDAEVKIFLTASAEVRATRRYEQLKEKYPETPHDFEQILQEIQARDTRDTTRAHAPLKKAEDALLIDTSNMSIDEVVERILGCVK